MKYFMILASDTKHSAPLRQQHVAVHRARLAELVSEGRLLMAGPLTDAAAEPDTGRVTGSLIVAGFESIEDATAWAEADIYQHSGVYQQIRITPFLPVLP